MKNARSRALQPPACWLSPDPIASPFGFRLSGATVDARDSSVGFYRSHNSVSAYDPGTRPGRSGVCGSIAEALVAGGLAILEVTLRNPNALEVIRRMNTVKGAVIGARTVFDPAQLDAALGAGAEFIVSPGLTRELGAAAINACVPFLPGITNSENIMRGLSLGLRHFKFFPAVASDGMPTLQALASVLGDARLRPTGGITEPSAGSWLSLEPVLCVRGSWFVPKGPVDAVAVEAAAHRAAYLRYPAGRLAGLESLL